MNKNVINCKKSEFVPGQTLQATVKNVCATGVMVKMPDGHGSGVISPRCWGTGIERETALAAIRPGDKFDVTVRLYDARTSTLSLVLVGCESLEPLRKKVNKPAHQSVRPSQGAACPHKPNFVTIAAGTTFLWDASNLLGAVGAENAARTFDVISRSLCEQGYKVMFFIERRCLTWALHNQRSAEEAAELEAFVHRGDIVVVGDGGNGAEEADCAILQMAEALPGSVCVSRDRFSDYAHLYPGIVGTDRVRSFSAVKIGGKTMVLVNGIAHAIVVDGMEEVALDAPSVQEPPASPSVAPDATPVPAQAAAQDVRAGVPDGRGGLFAVADKCIRRGDAKGAVRIYAKVAKRDPAAYRAIAEIYREGKVLPADHKKAMRYERLARKSEKSRRECSLRERRLRAEAIRGGRCSIGHFAEKRRKALSMAARSERHEMIREYLKSRRGRRGQCRDHVHAA